MRPVTKHDIISAVRNVGLKEGSTVMVHTSLSRIGYVCGGAQTVIEALIEVVGHEGTSHLEQGCTGLRAGAWAPPSPAGALPGPDHLRRADRSSDLLSAWVKPALSPDVHPGDVRCPPWWPQGNAVRPCLLRLWSSTPETCSSSDSGSTRTPAAGQSLRRLP